LLSFSDSYREKEGGLAMRGAKATGLSVTSPSSTLPIFTSGFPLLSLAEVVYFIHQAIKNNRTLKRFQEFICSIGL
jgi:hypothetical protein